MITQPQHDTYTCRECGRVAWADSIAWRSVEEADRTCRCPQCEDKFHARQIAAHEQRLQDKYRQQERVRRQPYYHDLPYEALTAEQRRWDRIYREDDLDRMEQGATND
jgi:DNA-directed RNA polymerase subunit RPC12/RpoP